MKLEKALKIAKEQFPNEFNNYELDMDVVDTLVAAVERLENELDSLTRQFYYYKD